jgi:hypothetical protein
MQNNEIQRLKENMKQGRFWKEKSVEDTFALGPHGEATLVMNGVGWFYKVNIVGWSK